jgi:dihydrofolate synthase/folylpolyglutamate synthase
MNWLQSIAYSLLASEALMTTEAGRPITTLAEAGAYLEGLINFERKPGFRYERLGLAPIQHLLSELGNPERALSIIHVAGSKGKGSTCLFAESILAALGDRVGTFTSPHLERWTERFRIAGREVDEAALARAVEHVRPHVERLRGDGAGNAPTFFDVTTATALVLFAEAGVSRVLLEVGLGGRLDSTNAVMPAVTCVTSIELEHTDKLGTTLAAIASEKAGILKPGVPCIQGRLAPEPDRAVRSRAEAVGASIERLGEHFDVEPAGVEPSSAGTVPLQTFEYRALDGFGLRAGLPVLGAHQLENAALALACIRKLGAHGDAQLREAAVRGLAGVSLPARVELLQRRPWIVVDAAHTVASARSLRCELEKLPGKRRHMLLSLSADKDLKAILDVLVPCADVLWLTRAEPIRSLDPERLAELARSCAPTLELEVVPDPESAVRRAAEALGSDDLLCCTGSVYLAGIARSVLCASGESARVDD